MYDLWPWFLILGIFLIILSGLLAGGLHETNPWIWAAFIVGAILILIGVILGIIAWSKEIQVTHSSSPFVPNILPNTSNIPPNVTDVPINMSDHDCRYVPVNNSPIVNSYTTSNNNSNYFSNSPPIDYNEYRYASPVGTPTPLKINIPQAQRGFTATNLQISSLAPEI